LTVYLQVFLAFNGLDSAGFVNNGSSSSFLTLNSKVHGKGLSEYSIKSLEDIYTAYPEYNSENTLILDDSPHKSSENKENALYLPTYTVSDKDFIPESDSALLSVLKYFESMGNAVSLKRCIKETPFGTMMEDQRRIRYNVMHINKDESIFSINDEWIVSSVEEIERWTEGRHAFRTTEPPSLSSLDLDPTAISKTQLKRLAKLEKKGERERQASCLILQSDKLAVMAERIETDKNRRELNGGERDLNRKEKRNIRKRREMMMSKMEEVNARRRARRAVVNRVMQIITRRRIRR
jgi:hypothetical protein